MNAPRAFVAVVVAVQTPTIQIQLPRRPARFGVVALVVLLLSTVVGADASTRWATLQAIHQLENPRNLQRPGRFGELGAYQFRAMTWRMHTNVPFQQALNREISDTVAVRHYEWIKRGLEAANIPATTYNIALAWNGGLGAVIAGKSPRRAHDYAARATNLATVFHESARMAVAQAQ